MGTIKEVIVRYFEETIQTKRGMKRRIYQLEADVKEARKNEAYAIDRMNRYIEANKKLRKKMRGEK
jgi:hypothetical protein